MARFGITAIAVPVRSYTWPDMSLDDFVPSVGGWSSCAWAMHEWIGYFWYALH